MLFRATPLVRVKPKDLVAAGVERVPRVIGVESGLPKLEDGRVTFSYKESATDQVKFSTISAEEFIRRFLQHVLPDHFVKVRYYGLLSPANRRLLEKVRELLGASPIDNSTLTQSQRDNEPSAAPRCPTCGSILKLIQRLKPQIRWPP